jgi:hypothetical protein
MESGKRRHSSCVIVVSFLALSAFAPALASDSAFPFGSELMLEAAPMRGSKRIPMLEIDDNGSTSIDLWCTSVQGQATVGGDGTITIVPGQAAAPAQCSADRASIDQDLMSALTQATNWRRNGDIIELTGTSTLRFRLMSN